MYCYSVWVYVIYEITVMFIIARKMLRFLRGYMYS
jgi:hypothetical protein